ncbi:uncharacterized protein LOC144197955 [Stigmatopora nigra]
MYWRKRKVPSMSRPELAFLTSPDVHFFQRQRQWTPGRRPDTAPVSQARSVASDRANDIRHGVRHGKNSAEAHDVKRRQRRGNGKKGQVGQKGGKRTERRNPERVTNGKPSVKYFTPEFKEQNAVILDGQIVCRHFLHGKCIKEGSCQMLHIQGSNDLVKEACKYYKVGFCMKGQQCPFMHKSFPCKFFHQKGRCPHNEDCRFSHLPLDDVSARLLSEATEADAQRANKAQETLVQSTAADQVAPVPPPAETADGWPRPFRFNFYNSAPPEVERQDASPAEGDGSAPAAPGPAWAGVAHGKDASPLGEPDSAKDARARREKAPPPPPPTGAERAATDVRPPPTGDVGRFGGLFSTLPQLAATRYQSLPPTYQTDQSPREAGAGLKTSDGLFSTPPHLAGAPKEALLPTTYQTNHIPPAPSEEGQVAAHGGKAGGKAGDGLHREEGAGETLRPGEKPHGGVVLAGADPSTKAPPHSLLKELFSCLSPLPADTP